MDVTEVLESIAKGSGDKQIVVIVVDGGKGLAPKGEELMEPDEQDSVREEADDFMEAFYEAVFGGTKQVTGGGGGGGSSMDGILQGSLTP